MDGSTSLDFAINDVFTEQSRGTGLCSCITNAINTPVFVGEREIVADLSDTGIYLKLFAGTLEYAIFPHARSPQYADRSGIHTRTNAWNGAAKEIRGNVSDGAW